MIVRLFYYQTCWLNRFIACCVAAVWRLLSLSYAHSVRARLCISRVRGDGVMGVEVRSWWRRRGTGMGMADGRGGLGGSFS